MEPRKTYWHLQAARRAPTEYEIASSRLLSYVGRGFEVDLPASDWYRRHQAESRFRAPSPDAFRDPRETTYATYVALQQEREAVVNGLLSFIETEGYDARLPEAWLRTLARLLPPLRYPLHGLQMIAAYVGQMAPCGRITLAAMFQCADEMRRIQRLAYRMRQVQETRPGFGGDAKELWERDPMWQPLREAVEKLLVAYDWGEAFVGLNVVLKPRLDFLFLDAFGRTAAAAGDGRLQEIFYSLAEDARWQRAWTAEMLRTAFSEHPGNRETVAEWIDRWSPPARRATDAFAPLLDAGGSVETMWKSWVDGAGMELAATASRKGNP